MISRPLAERMRPTSLDEYVGQQHLVGKDAPLRKALDSGRIPSMILWGPPGVGKTTLAKLMAGHLKRTVYELSAINSGVKDVRETIKKAENQNFFQQGSPILFIDEIHRFSKSQQDSLLAAVERGIVTLVGATTENPSFEVISALLSRCQVYILEHHSVDELLHIANTAINNDESLSKYNLKITEHEALIRYCGGDARKLLNILEILSTQSDPDSGLIIDNALVESTLQREISRYDKSGESHYDTVSAFIKSVRGSDPDAAVYYLARMIDGGEDPKFICRRMIILASEDIGLANPNALLLANACFDAVNNIGLPEGRIPMAQCAIYMAKSPKSNTAYTAINEALASVKKNSNLPIPLHLRNAPTKLMKEIGYGKDYLYPHNYDKGQVAQEYLPEGLRGTKFYTPSNIGGDK